MNNVIYFNHNTLADQNRETIEDCLSEILRLSSFVKENNYELKFYWKLWEIKVNDKDLRSILSERKFSEKTMGLIYAIINSGPFYCDEDKFDSAESVIINPEVPCNSAILNMLASCIIWGQSIILSQKQEQILTHDNYNLVHEDESYDLINIIGEDKLTEFIFSQNIPKSIDEVFERISRFDHVVILDSAKKSARKYDFSSTLLSVEKVLECLSSIEFMDVNNNLTNENRKMHFKNKTGFEFSEESIETIRHPRFRAQRLFQISPGNKQCFTLHAKIGGSLRIHFLIENGILYIGYCGNHLSTVNNK